MSRRRGEFEHRTSIFEGAYRAWSFLGGLDPLDLETKSLAELDPLSDAAEILSKKDPRLSNPEYKEQVEEGNNGRRIYPYEPLPRTGLAHPFVQSILSPWLGPEAESHAIQLGLTTLRTWWQHRRKGESGSAIAALGTEKMAGVVEGYTRHFFSLAYSLVKNDKESPPRSLFTKIKELEKQRCKQAKRKSREDDAANFTALAHAHGLNSSINTQGSVATSSDLLDIYRRASEAQGRLDIGNSFTSTSTSGSAMGLPQNLTALEQFALMQSQLHPESRPSMSPSMMQYIPENLGLQQLALQQLQAQATRNLLLGELIGASLKMGGSMNSSSSTSIPAATLSSDNSNAFTKLASVKTDAGDDELESKTPIVVVSPSGDIHIAMKLDGMTCLHCVKIVETVLKGCTGKKPPIDGLLDAAADHELSSVIIKIDMSSNAKRIAKESARNLAMVGYTAKVMDMTVDLTATRAHSSKADIGFLNSAFEVLANMDTADVFDWSLLCSCQANGFSKKECKRHNQMNPRIFQVFRDHENSSSLFASGCGKRLGRECTCEPGKCMCPDCGDCRSSRSLNEESNPAKVLSHSGCCSINNLQDTEVIGEDEQLTDKDGEEMTSEQISKYLMGTAVAAAKAFGSARSETTSKYRRRRSSDSLLAPLLERLARSQQFDIQEKDDIEMLSAQSYTKPQTALAAPKTSQRDSITMGRRRFSTQSENTFGRALSGLSALSIDWENMDDFDVNVDHSAHVNNELKYPKPNDEDMAESIMAGCAMLQGGECTCGPMCFCVGCTIHDKERSADVPVSNNGFRRSSFLSRRVGGNELPLSVCFKDE